MRDPQSSVVKIGYTGGPPRKRLQALQTGSPEHLVLWACTPATLEVECVLHATFDHLRSHGEWFFAQHKLKVLLQYLGDEPEIGREVPPGEFRDIISDVVLSDIPPHPRFDEAEWIASGCSKTAACLLDGVE